MRSPDTCTTGLILSPLSRPKIAEGGVMNHVFRAAGRLAALAFAALVCGGALAQAYPSRPITFVVPWGAGGGTDTTARYFAAMMEKELGQPVNVVNRTGGGGVVGHSAIASAPPGGYPIGMITVEDTMLHWQDRKV